MILGVYGLCFSVGQTDFLSILLFWIPITLAYSWLIFSKSKNLENNHCFYLFLAFSLRAIALFSFPSLSDDIYRFYWDGILWTNGINPLEQLPAYYMQNGVEHAGLNKALYDQLNSPEYFTIYPPVLQGFFAFAASMGNSVEAVSIILKTILMVLETGTIFLLHGILKKLDLPINRVFWYALNPLVIIEIMGNLHFEGAMVFFMALFIWLILKNNWVKSAFALAFAIGSKLLPLMFIPAILKYLGWKNAGKWLMILGCTILALMIPFWDSLLFQNFGNSFDLYFRKFEFNASLYYIFREIGIWITGYNQIAILGPALALSATFLIILFALKVKKQQAFILLDVLLISFSIYLLSSATVHPWYIILPVFLSVFSRFQFPLVWSLVVILSYAHYWKGAFVESYFLIGIEYLIVGFYLMYEVRNTRMVQKLSGIPGF
jgi:hypothetical protein